MTPALLARIQPSSDDQIVPWRVAQILAETKEQLIALGGRSAALQSGIAGTGGRPGVITPRLAENIRSLSAKGIGPHRIAKELKISRSTVYKAAQLHDIALVDSRRGGEPKVPRSKRHIMQPGGREYPPLSRSTGG